MSVKSSPDYGLFKRRLSLNLGVIQSSMAISCDGHVLITGGQEDRTIKVWDLQTGQILRAWVTGATSFSRDENRVYTLALSLDGRTLVSGGSLIQVWNLETGQRIRVLKGGGWALYTAISPDGATLVTYNEDKTVVWNLITGKKVRSRFGDTDAVESLVISPDNKTLAGGDGFDHTIKVWDLTTGQTLYTLEASSAVKVFRLAISPNGQLIAGSGFDGIQFWNYATGEHVQIISKFSNLRFHEHLDNVTCPTFSPDGKTLLTCGNDGLIQIWDVVTGKNIYSIECQNQVNSLILSTDGSTLAAHSRAERVVEIWGMA